MKGLCEYRIDKKKFNVRIDGEGTLTIDNVILDRNQFKILKDDEDELIITFFNSRY